MKTPNPHLSRTPARRDIQGLRALAVVAVVLAHAIGWPRGGFAGVDVFFVVSGFLITGLLLREVADTGRISLRTFYARRIRRILPAAILVLVVVAAVSFFVFNRARADQTLWDAVAAFAVVANWRFAAEGTDYFHAADAVSPLQHFWSLSVEEQFYLVWPGLLLILVLLLPVAARRRAGGRAVVAVAALVVLGASGGWAMLQTASEPTLAYFSTATRAWELAVGALLAVAAPALSRLPAAVRWPLGWIGVAAVVGSFVILDPDTMPFPAPWAALPVGAAALVIAAGVGGDPRQRHLFPVTNPVGVFVGDISYSLYLWHFPVIVFAAVLLPAGAEATPIVLVAIAVLTLGSYFLVEQPLHRSPWLRGVEGASAAPAGSAQPTAPVQRAAQTLPAGPTAPTAAVERFAPTATAEHAPSSPRLPSTRPAGWTPGTRYYPGSRPRPLAPAALEAAAPEPAAASVTEWQTDAATPPPRTGGISRTDGPDRTGRLDPAGRPDPAPDTDGPDGPKRTGGTAADENDPAPRSWAAWRARYRSQFALSAAGLGIGAGLVVVMVLLGYGAPAGIVPLAPPVAGAPAADEGDPTAAVQEQLADALAATSWPELRPSLDEVIQRSSAANPAHDCFSPDVAIDLGRCTWGDSRAPRHMYLVGDSSAMAYAPAFKKLAEDSGGSWRVTTVGLYGCRFTEVLVQNDGAGVMAACPQRKSDVRAMVGGDPADLVVVSNAYTLARTVDGRSLSAYDLLLSSQREMAGYGAEGRVVYLAPPPHGGDLSRCYSPVSSPADCATAVDPTWHAMQSAAEAVAAASGDHAIGSLSFSCWNEVCPAFAGGLPIRYDETHLTVPYAEHIAPVLRANLATLGLY